MKTDYNRVSKIYDERYKTSKLPGIVNKLQSITDRDKSQKIIEIGCGTGYWLSNIDKINILYGLDLSLGMLKKAKINEGLNLFCGDANKLPIKQGIFDIVFSINAMHHFPNAKEFVLSSINLLKHGGKFCIFATNPVDIENEWYIFKYFKNTYQNDQKRFPAIDDILDWVEEAGYKNVKKEHSDIVINKKVNYEIFDDTFLVKDATSQLSDITDEEYNIGIKLMKADIENNLKLNKNTEFNTILNFYMIYGEKE
ncbi:MAG TPA: class I SAM-dependent methyltransferase [Melioribacteraceae bacterium]|nr:class I SAM-dependent methyltransferase [Melioribacteraceae bacterium]